MARSSARSSSSHRQAKASGKSLLRLEPLEPRLLLSVNPLSPQVSSATVTLAALADAYVSGSNPWGNLGKTTDLLVQSSTSRSTSNDSEAYLKFDLSSITGPVSKAMLNLVPLGVGAAASSMTVGVQLLPDASDGWIEGSGGSNYSSTGAITWMNAPYGSGQVLTISGSQLKASTPIAIDVTQLINQAWNANHIASFVIGVTSSPGRQRVGRLCLARKCQCRLAAHLDGDDQRPRQSAADRGPAAADHGPDEHDRRALGDRRRRRQRPQNLVYTWSVASPAGAATPLFSSNGANNSKTTTVTFSQSGTYVFTTKITDAIDGLSVTSNSLTVTVNQVLSNITVSPASVSLTLGARSSSPSRASTSSSRRCPFRRGVSRGRPRRLVQRRQQRQHRDLCGPRHGDHRHDHCQGRLAYGHRQGNRGRVELPRPSRFLPGQPYSEPGRGRLRQPHRHDADSRSVESENGGVLDAMDFSDLKTILNDATTLNMPGYVLVLASDVVNGNAANAHYLGQALGNLAAGSTATQLEDLVDKWFLGTDLPVTGGYSYDASTRARCSAADPSHNDEKQGDLGDCYFISSLGAIADSSPAAIKNMLIDNGDGTWTVRFYVNGTADYVTVNSRLPVDSSGNLVFDGFGSKRRSLSNVLWIPLLEKAYAQWNETGKEGRNGQNSYAAIAGGWMADVDAQVLGYAAASYSLTSSAQQTLINAVTGHKAVTIGTINSPAASTGLYGSHAYAVIGYANGLFTLYNPWGSNQPALLSWSQLQQNCAGFVVADASGTVPIKRGQVRPPPFVHLAADSRSGDGITKYGGFLSIGRARRRRAVFHQPRSGTTGGVGGRCVADGWRRADRQPIACDGDRDIGAG